MPFDHDTMIAISKSFGLFYLIGLSIAVIIYAYWPSNRKWFDRAAENAIRAEDKPCP